MATVGPQSGQAEVRKLIASLQNTYAPSDRRDYVPRYPGFKATFHAEIALAEDDAAHIRWPDGLDSFPGSGTETTQLAEAIRTAVARLAAAFDAFDVAVVHLPEAWRAASSNPEFDADDYLKAQGALQASQPRS